MLLSSGKAEVFRLDTGAVRASHQVFERGELVTSSFLLRDTTAAFGLADGSVQLANVAFVTEILDAEDLPADVVAQAPEENDVVDFKDGVVQRTPTGQFRYQRLAIEMGASVRVSSGPVQKLDLVVRSEGPLIAALVDAAPPSMEPSAPSHGHEAVARRPGVGVSR